MLGKSPDLFDDGRQSSQAREKEEQTAELERIVGRTTDDAVR